MIDVDKIQIGDKLRVDSERYAYGGDSRYNIKAGTVLPVIQEDRDRSHWIDNKGAEVNYIDIEDAQDFTLVATNTKYSDIDEGDTVEIACLSDEQIATWSCGHIIDQQGEVIHKSKSIHVEIDGKEWCLQPENLRVVEKVKPKVGFINKSFDSALKAAEAFNQQEQYTGGSSDYYKVFVKNPTTLLQPYEAECNDIIEALQMNFAEGNAFKAIWRKAKARQGVKKKGYDNGVYDSEKVIFFGERMLIEAKGKDNEPI